MPYLLQKDTVFLFGAIGLHLKGSSGKDKCKKNLKEAVLHPHGTNCQYTPLRRTVKKIFREAARFPFGGYFGNDGIMIYDSNLAPLHKNVQAALQEVILGRTP